MSATVEIAAIFAREASQRRRHRCVHAHALPRVDEESLGQLPREAGAAQLLEGIPAARKLRIHEHRAVRQRGRWQVMIRDHDVDAAARGLGHGLDRGDPAVDGHDALRLVLLRARAGASTPEGRSRPGSRCGMKGRASAPSFRRTVVRIASAPTPSQS